MIQRIQSIFLLVAALLNLGILASPLWKYQSAKNVEIIKGMEIESVFDGAADKVQEQAFTSEIPHISLFAFTLIASLGIIFVIFQYNDRKRQIRLAYIGIVMILVEILSLVLLSRAGPFMLVADLQGGKPQWGFALPITAVLLVMVAIRYIRKDEELVKSIDRIR